ncbi:MAG: hypothetical protein Q9162_001685 [Coniocarpon cinnabarinum]
MSSRALRKAQREREKTQDPPLHEGNNEGPASDTPRGRANPNASGFELLAQAGDEEDESEADEVGDASDHEPQDENHDGVNELGHQRAPPSTMKRKKKKKKKASKSVEAPALHQKPETGDIDALLKQLSVSAVSENAQNRPPTASEAQRHADPTMLETFATYAVDSHHLHVHNEMRRLFGDISFDDPEEPEHQPRQPGEQIGLAEAIKGKNSASGTGLPAVLRKKNIFVEASVDWPKASGGGLSMEIESTGDYGIVLFRFVHDKSYQSAQKEFELSVRSMDPSVMINSLRFNPYHVGTLLQVSEIAKQEKDYASTGELIERALFSFGRAAHPRFGQAMSQGKARLDFHRPENREFYLAAWRYIQNIGMRATWRTAYEWAKILLQLDPDVDWYSIRLCIDQLALRSRQTDAVLKLCEAAGDGRLGHANLMFSAALARHMNKNPVANDDMRAAIKRFPWVAAGLCQALGMAKIPPAIWGSEAPTETTRLYSELYTTQAVDLWKTQDATDFLKSAAESLTREECRREADNQDRQRISKCDARHVLLLEKPPLIALLPTVLTSQLTSASDPLPPDGNQDSYTGASGTLPDNIPHDLPVMMLQESPEWFIAVLSESERQLELLVPGLADRLDERREDEDVSMSPEDLGTALRRADVSTARWLDMFNRSLRLRGALQQQPGRRVEGRNREVAYFNEEGRLRIEMTNGPR